MCSEYIECINGMEEFFLALMSVPSEQMNLTQMNLTDEKTDFISVYPGPRIYPDRLYDRR